jgi:hypothetical protein
MKLGRQEILLVLLAVTAVRLWTARSPAAVSLPPLARGSEEARLLDAPVVNLATLQGSSDLGASLERDLFAYARRRVPAPALAPRRGPVSQAPPASADPPPSPVAPVAMRTLPPPMSAGYLGSMGPRGARLAFFDHDRKVVMVGEGETFLHDFRVVRIGYETVTIGFTSPQFKDEVQEIPMSRTR